jgi:hypothetical protein
MLARKNIMTTRTPPSIGRLVGNRRALLGPLRLFAPLAVSVASSCGGAPASPQAPASSAGPVASAVMPAAPDLGPVPTPPGLVVTGTVTKLGASLATVHGWIQLPMPQSDQVTEIVAGQPLGAIVDLDQPIHVAVAVAGAGVRLTPLVAISAGIRDVDAVKAALSARYKLTPGDNGALVIQSLGHPSRPDGTDDDKGSDDDDPRACELAPSYGSPAMRLVCGWDAKSLAALGPWLTRGATRDRLPAADAHVELRMEPLKPTIAQERKLLSLLLGTALGGRPGGGVAGARDLVQAVAGDLADFGTDLDTASLDVALSDPGAAATLTLKLSGATSALARLAMANADRNGPPPAAFWQMPGDADFAVFDRGIDPNVLARGRDLVLKLVSDGLAEDGVKDADRHAFVDALGKLVSPAPTVYASGVDADAVRKALAALKALPDTADRAQAREASRVATQALLGWRIVEADEPAAGRVDAMKGLVTAWSRPSVAAAYKKAADGWLGIRSAPLPKGTTLPKDTQHFAIDVPLVEPAAASRAPSKKPAGPAKPLAIDVFIVPDGARSWIGVGGDAALVTARLSAAIAGTGDVLRGRAELAAFKEATVGAGGFFTARGVAETGEQLAALTGGDAGGFANGADIFESAAQVPHQGTTAIPFSLTAPSVAQGTQAGVVATLQVSRATVDDLLVVALKHGF